MSSINQQIAMPKNETGNENETENVKSDYDVPVGGTINAPYMPTRFIDEDGRIFYKSQSLIYDGVNDVDYNNIGFNLSSAVNSKLSSSPYIDKYVMFVHGLPNNNVGVLHFTSVIDSSSATRCDLDYETINYDWFNKGLPPVGYTRNKSTVVSIASASASSSATSAEKAAGASNCRPVYVEIVNSILFILTVQKKLYYRSISGSDSFTVVDLSTIITAGDIGSIGLYYKILFINNKYFFYVSTSNNYYTGTLLTSTNLSTWTTVTTTPPFSSVQMNLFTFKGKILAFHRDLNAGYYYSSDYGATWSSKQNLMTLGAGTRPQLYDIQIVNDKLFVLGGVSNSGPSATSTNYQVLSYTTDGINWTTINVPNIVDTVNYTYNFFEAIVYNSNLFILGSINSAYPIDTAASVSHNGLSVPNYSVFKINLNDMTVTNVKINQLSNILSMARPSNYTFYGASKLEADNINDSKIDDLKVRFYNGRLLQIASSNKLSLTIPTTTIIHKFVLNEDTNNFESAGFGEDINVCQKINDKFSISLNRDKIFISNTSDYPILSIPDLSLSGQTHLRTK